MMTPHYHYWLLGALADGRPCYVQDPQVFNSKPTCWRHARARHGDGFMVMLCRDEHT